MYSRIGVKNIHSLFIALIFLFGIFSTVILHLFLKSPSLYFLDSIYYIRLAEKIQTGHWFIENRYGNFQTFAPFYPILISLLERIIHNFENAGIYISIIAGSFATTIAILLARIFYKTNMGWLWLVLVFFMFNPFYVLYSSAVLTEALFTFLFLTAICVIYLALSKNSLLMWFSAGIIGGMAWLTRDVGVIVPITASIWIIIGLIKNKNSIIKFICFGALFTMGILMVYLPIKILVHFDSSGVTRLQPKSTIIYNILAPNTKELLMSELYLRKLTPEGEYAFIPVMKKMKWMRLFTDWKWIVERFIINVFGVGRSMALIFFVIFFPFIFVGIYALKNSEKKLAGQPFIWPQKRYLFLLSFVFLYILFYAVAGGFTGPLSPERYLVPIIPILGIWCVAGLLSTGEKISKMFGKKIGALFVSSFIIFFLMVSALSIVFISKTHIPFYQNKTDLMGLAMLGIFERHPNQDQLIIMSRRTFLSYFTNSLPILTPYGEYDEIIKFAKSKKVDFFFLENSLYAPQLEFLKNTKISTPELKFILQIEQGNLYQLIY